MSPLNITISRPPFVGVAFAMEKADGSVSLESAVLRPLSAHPKLRPQTISFKIVSRSEVVVDRVNVETREPELRRWLEAELDQAEQAKQSLLQGLFDDVLVIDAATVPDAEGMSLR